MNGVLEISVEVLPKDLGDVFNFGKVKKEIFEDLEPEIERWGQIVLGESPPSARGGHPAKRTGALQRSSSAQVVGDILELSVLDYGGYQDPVFEGQVKSAGWTDRPFVQDILDLAVNSL